MITKGTYISNELALRIEAYEMGYDNIGSHPNHIGEPCVNDFLVIDLDNILFGDQAKSVQIANEHACQGVRVGIHTYYPDDPLVNNLDEIIVVAKTHQEVYDFLLGLPPRRTPTAEELAANERDMQLWIQCALEEIEEQCEIELARQQEQSKFRICDESVTEFLTDTSGS